MEGLKATSSHYKDLTEGEMEKETSGKKAILEIKNAYIVL